MSKLLSRFDRKRCLENTLVLSLLPFYFEVSFAEFSRLNKLHIVDIDFLCNEIGLLKSSLIIVVDEAIDDSEL